MANIMIHAENIVKDYPKIRALDHVCLDLYEGEIFGLFGPNAAGKTTCIRVLTGITKPNSGSAYVCGVDLVRAPIEIRKIVSILPEAYFMYEDLSVFRYLKFFAKMAGITSNANTSVQEALSIVEMTDKASTKIKTLSLGQKQRIEIGRVLLGTLSNAKILFLDEPFNNIDIQMRIKLRSYLREFLRDGRSVFFTSHNLIESEYMVDRFAFIVRGRITAVGTAKDLKERFLVPTFFLELKKEDIEKAKDMLLQSLDTFGLDTVEHGLRIILKNREDIPKISKLLVESNINIFEMRALGTMEDVFEKVVAL